MKKICGKKLAFLLAACVLAAGTFVSCGEKETEDPTAADSLAKPTGNDPFTTGLYKAEVTYKSGGSDDMYYDIDTNNRTMNIGEHKGELFTQQKYTYDGNSVTMVIYKQKMPSDIDAYISSVIDDSKGEYDGNWKYAGKSEYVSAVEKMAKAMIPFTEKQLQDSTLSDKERKELEHDLNYWKNEAVKEAIEEFDKPEVTYAYTKDGNVITLTNTTADAKILVLTPVSN
ncbi:MAG: hypothetical protein K2J81_05195 [Treponemataceae bacterium]|nr:hypothetical protein [Treponemataceae bacterium]